MKTLIAIVALVVVVFAVAAAIFVGLGMLIGTIIHYVINAIDMSFATLIGVVTVGFLALLTLQLLKVMNEIKIEQTASPRPTFQQTKRGSTRRKPSQRYNKTYKKIDQ